MQKVMGYARQNYKHPPLIGAAFAALMVLSPLVLSGHPFLIFFSLGGLVIVVGGMITTAYMSFDAGEVRKALNAIEQMFRKSPAAPYDVQADITAIVYCARLLQDQKEGMRSLETVISKSGVRDPFLKYGLNMVVSDYPQEDVRAMMEIAADATYEHESVPVDVLQAMTSHGPAFGMVGTLVGMVAMLGHLTGDVADMGPSLAVAFLSTLYGVLSARLICIPAASRLRQEVDQKRVRNFLVSEGLAMLAAKKSPMYVQDRLNGFLRPEAYNYFDVTAKQRPDFAPGVAAMPKSVPIRTARAVA